MYFKEKSILFLFISLYFILGINLLLVICNMAMTMLHSFHYVVASKPEESIVKDFLMLLIISFVILFGAIYFVITSVVYFFVKRNDWIFTLIFSLISILMFGEIALLVFYNAFYSHDFKDTTMNVMIEDMNMHNSRWDNFQINMHCCGVHQPEDYKNSIPSSCCGHSGKSFDFETNCTIDDSYQIGCHSKLIVYIQEYNQLIILTGIVFDIFTMLVLFLLRYSKMFVVINDKPRTSAFVAGSFNLD